MKAIFFSWKIYVALVAAVFIALSLYIYLKLDHKNSVASKNISAVILGKQTIFVEVSDTEEEQEKGLSGRRGLNEDEGMLFVFNRAEKWGIWMKDMLFSIDILWIDSNGIIQNVEQNVSPKTFPQIFQPKVPVSYVLELPDGLFSKTNLKVGDSVYIVRK